VTPGNAELIQAQSGAAMTLPGKSYRFVIFQNGAFSAVPADFTKSRVRITNRHTLFVDPASRRVLMKPDGGNWQGKQISNV
jgi:hypothetical protein